ncbi:acyl-CoA dehydrogenase [Pusillimonas caeni]|uniref:acyl-CoA dehydrogenase family protein n=1 Tax=Pusillimonas caeni TaxID=1348472 RepID=UPI000E59ABEE|nr:acyl-CoA dehydrogenase family protein [Pusillimonas caeni]TFL13317.1 acyl-CoA dehydrogenase [Pusillimonas caeni]
MPIQKPWDDEVVQGVQRFVQQKIVGRAQELEADQRYPEEIVSALKELGLFSIAVPQEYGGLELSVPTYARIMEELAAGWTTLSCFLNSHTSASSILARHGTEAQKQKWLPRMATGELRVAIALTEPNGGSDLQAIRSKARKEAGGGYVLNGSKIFITNGARAGAVVVLARTADGKDGISLFMIEKGLPGFTVGANARTLGHRHIDVAELVFQDVKLPAGSLIGQVEGQGLKQMLDALETGRIAMAATAVGLSRSALKAAQDFAMQRVAFGTEIINHQAIQMHLADMATQTMAAQSLVQTAAAVKQSGERADMVCGMAKLFAGETCAKVALDCVRIHGGGGFVSDFPAERYYREAPYFIVTEGTNEIQKLIIAKRMQAGDAEALGL